MNRWLSNIGFGSCAAVFYLLISGCTTSGAPIDPDELFQKTLHSLSEEEHRIQWEDTSSIISEHTMNKNWNPLAHTEWFKQGTTTITIDQDQSNQQAIVLSVILDNPTAKEVLMDQLHNQMDEIRLEVPHASEGNPLSKGDKERMSKEVQTYIDDADRRLLDRLDTSEVHSTIFLWVERDTEKPIRVQLHTTINDMNKGQKLKETLKESYLIS